MTEDNQVNTASFLSPTTIKTRPMTNRKLETAAVQLGMLALLLCYMMVGFDASISIESLGVSFVKNSTNNDLGSEVAPQHEEPPTTSTEVSHRHCWRLFGTPAARFQQTLFSRVKYLPVDPNSPDYVPPKYDPNTCFVVNPTSTCPHHEEAYNPTDWKVVIEAPPRRPTDPSSTLSHSEDICDLPAFARDMQGPTGVANHLLSESNHPNGMYNVLMMGDSRLQQVWEALVCGWSHDITRITLQVNATRDHTTNRPATGTLLTSNLAYAQSHPCHDDASANPTSNCDDSIAMVEFGNKIRFYFLHDPHDYLSNLRDVTDVLGLPSLANIDQLVLNHDLSKLLLKEDWDRKLSAGVWTHQIQWNADSFRTLQSPDNLLVGDHECMPAVRDHQVNVLLLLLLKQIANRHNSLNTPLTRIPLVNPKRWHP